MLKHLNTYIKIIVVLNKYESKGYKMSENNNNYVLRINFILELFIRRR